MSAYDVFKTNGTIKPVKNLGWLRKHWKDVESFSAYPTLWGGVNLHAFLKGEAYLFIAEFSDEKVLWDWLCRPIFLGQKIKWFGINRVIEKQKITKPENVITIPEAKG